jgi:hypothetical protein
MIEIDEVLNCGILNNEFIYFEAVTKSGALNNIHAKPTRWNVSRTDKKDFILLSRFGVTKLVFLKFSLKYIKIER